MRFNRTSVLASGIVLTTIVLLAGLSLAFWMTAKQHQDLAEIIWDLGGDCTLSKKGVPEIDVITHVSLYRCPVERPLLRRLADLGTIEELSLELTDIQDRDSVHLASMDSLRSLSIAGTNISDEGLVQLEKLPQLTTLDLRYLPISNQGIRALCGIASLEEVYLFGTDVDQEGIRQLRTSRPDVEVLWSQSQPTQQFRKQIVALQAAGISTEFIDRPSFPGPPILYLGFDDSSDVNPRLMAMIEEIGPRHLIDLRCSFDRRWSLTFVNHLSKIHRLSLGSNRLTASTIEELKSDLEVTCLTLTAPLVSDQGLSHIATISSIRELHIRDSTITSNGLEVLKSLTNLRLLELRGDQFGDSVISVLSSLPELEELSLDCPNMTTSAIDTLRKLRPDVNVQTFRQP